MINVFIYGLGRIGRATTRLILDSYSSKFEIFGFADPVLTPSKFAYLLKYDTVYGMSSHDIGSDDSSGKVIIDSKEYPFYTSPNLSSNFDGGIIGQNKIIVIDCSGLSDSGGTRAQDFLALGARYVAYFYPMVISGLGVAYLGKGLNSTIDSGVTLISTVSCSTQAAAQVLNTLKNNLPNTLEQGSITSIHAYTNDQSAVDSYSFTDVRGRAAAQNIIPTTTTANKYIGRLITEYNGKITGIAYRVPVLCGSLLQFELVYSDSSGSITKEGVWDALRQYFDNNQDDLVSSDIIGYSKSIQPIYNSIRVINSNDRTLVKLAVIFDNEMGFAMDSLDCLTEAQTNNQLPNLT